MRQYGERATSIMVNRVASPESTGGSGTLYEYRIASVALATLLTGRHMPFEIELPLARVGLQQKINDYELDDIVYISDDPRRVTVQAQVKKTLRVQGSNKALREFLKQAVAALAANVQDIADGKMMLGLIADGDVSHLAVLERLSANARSASGIDDFHNLLATSGDLASRFQHVVDAMEDVISDTARSDLAKITHQVLSALRVWHADASEQERYALDGLSSIHLPEGMNASDLLNLLYKIACKAGPHAGTFDRVSLVRAVREHGVQIEALPSPRPGLVITGTVTKAKRLLKMRIHRSIPLAADIDSGAELDPDLTSYIPRDIDRDLQRWVSDHRNTGGFLLLQGDAASGKTRCAYELAVRSLGDWPVVIPDTTRQLSRFFQGEPDVDRLVVWLDDVDRFFEGGLLQEVYRQILDFRAPVIIIGTVWPDRYIEIARTAEKESVLRIADRYIVPHEFSDSEMKSANGLAEGDGRIAEALAADEQLRSQVPATLANAWPLIVHWMTSSNRYGKEVVTAAVAARRCGYPDPVPESVIKVLAESFLSGADREGLPSTWFIDGLAWAEEKVLDTIAPISQSDVADDDNGKQYRVSDILVQHGNIDKRSPGHEINKKTWRLIVDHAPVETMYWIGSEANRDDDNDLSDIAELAYTKGADAGSAVCAFSLGSLRVKQHRDIEAIEWFCKVADIDDHDSPGYRMSTLFAGVMYAEQGIYDEAVKWLSRAAEDGESWAMFNLGVVYRKLANDELADLWFKRAAVDEDGGANVSAMVALGISNEKRDGRQAREDAEGWYLKAAAHEDNSSIFALGNLSDDEGNIATGVQWYRLGADERHRDYNSMLALSIRLSENGQSEEAERWHHSAEIHWRNTVLSGYRESYMAMQEDPRFERMSHWALRNSHRTEPEWEMLLRGPTKTAFLLGLMSVDGERLEEGEHFYRMAADKGNSGAMFGLALLFSKRGDLAEAMQWSRKAASCERQERVDFFNPLGVVLR